MPRTADSLGSRSSQSLCEHAFARLAARAAAKGIVTLISCLILCRILTIPPSDAEEIHTPAYLVDGRPVNPFCLIGLVGKDRTESISVDLGKCGTSDIVILAGSTDPNMIGFQYRLKRPTHDLHDRFIFYRHVGNYRGHALLFIEYGLGGIAEYTELVPVDRVGLVVTAAKAIAAGDRCNGGIFNVALSDAHLSYDQRITESGLLRLSRTLLQLDTHKDGIASVPVCLATVRTVDRRWTSVTLTRTNVSDENRLPDTFAYEACFSRIYRAYVVRRKTELDVEDVTQFVNKFVGACLPAR